MEAVAEVDLVEASNEGVEGRDDDASDDGTEGGGTTWRDTEGEEGGKRAFHWWKLESSELLRFWTKLKELQNPTELYSLRSYVCAKCSLNLSIYLHGQSENGMGDRGVGSG